MKTLYELRMEVGGEGRSLSPKLRTRVRAEKLRRYVEKRTGATVYLAPLRVRTGRVGRREGKGQP